MAPKSERYLRAAQRKAERSEQRAKERELEREERLASRGFVLKLNRASKHIEDLGQVTDAWLGTNAYSFVTQRDSKTGRTIVRANISKPPPPVIALVAGDAAHALRAALDHVAFELATAFHRKAVPPAIEKHSQFVIIGDADPAKGKARFDGAAKTQLKGIDPAARKVIEGIQPYHGCAAYTEDPLWIIHELDRIDKHRRINFTTYAIGGVSVALGRGPGFHHVERFQVEKGNHRGPVHHGTEVLVFVLRGKIDCEIQIAREIALAEPSLALEQPFVVAVLSSLRDYVRDKVIPLLNPFL